MNKIDISTTNELPPKGKLIKSSIIAICVASTILLTVVLPAEYNIDPTGFGNVLGLVKMGEIKVSLDQRKNGNKFIYDFRDDEISSKFMSFEELNSSDKLIITLIPNEGKEIKLAMSKGQKVKFSWWTNGEEAYFDAHGDSQSQNINYHKYSTGSKKRLQGILKAEFDGRHGWFWRNQSSESMVVTLLVSGTYSDIKLIK